jgi:hypothetical protein
MMQRREPKDVVLHDDHLLGVLLGDRAVLLRPRSLQSPKGSRLPVPARRPMPVN